MGVCKICGAKANSEYCFRHKPKAPIKQTPLKRNTNKKVPVKKPKLPRGKKAHAQKRNSIKKLKAKLWTIFSKFVRMRDADEYGYITCITSGERMFWRESHAGHFMSRRFNSTFIHEQNVMAQSPRENLWMAGNQFIFGQRLNEIFGPGTAEKLVELSKQNFKFTVDWLEEKIEHYTKEVKRLQIEKGL